MGRPYHRLHPWWRTLLLERVGIWKRGVSVPCCQQPHSIADKLHRFGWLSNLSSLFTLFNWALINLSHIRMRQAWKKQGRSTEELPWTSGTYPWSAWWGVGCCVVVMIIEFYLSVWPPGESSSAEFFFANYVSVILIIALWLGARLYYRGPWLVPLESINLDAGRRFYVDVQDEEKRTPPSGENMRKGLVTFLTTSGGF